MQTPTARFPWLQHATVGFSVLALALALLAVAIGAIAGLGTRWEWWHFSRGFTLLRWATHIALVAAGLSLPGLLAAGLTRRWTALAGATVALALGLVVVWLPWQQLRIARSVPPIHDITTDVEHPPPFVDVLPLRAGAPNPPRYAGPEAAEQQRQAYPDILPAHFAESPERVFAAVEAAAQAMGWEVVAAVPSEGRLEASATTFWFGFTDDVVVRVVPAGSGTRVDVRSKSRVGVSDVGANARRIRAFLGRLRASGLSAIP